MSAIPKLRPDLPAGAKVYPESDGKPMADNTIQYRWIQVLQGNLASLYRDDPNVFVAGDLLWYPVEGFPEIRNAPDVMVAFGRPKGDRGSYQQWLEEGIAPQVVFEILSPGNTQREMRAKWLWYEEYGVEEYYVYNPDDDTLSVYLRQHDWLMPYFYKQGRFHSRLTNVRFDLNGDEMAVFYPDGRPFLTFEQLAEARDRAEREAADARQAAAEAAKRAADAIEDADEARKVAEDARKATVDADKRAGDAIKAAGDADKRAGDAIKAAVDADKRADDASKRADDANNRADDAARAARRLAELSRKARRGAASAEELAELERLEAEASG